ncbi:hypothetical protein ABE073_04875 [Lederbergia citrisecunda]|uniref:hypothetical protein n=1 Tax=Lederbergia citrisecunda TaxID=2833583 RepID=UPI003D29739D
MMIEIETQVAKIKLDLTEEEFNTLYTAMNITSTDIIINNAKNNNLKVLDSQGQRELFNQMQSGLNNI